MTADTQLLASLDERLRNVIAEPRASGDRASLLTVLKLVNSTNPAKRANVWTHYERKIGHQLGNHVARMREAYELIEASLTDSPAKQRLAAIKAKARGKGLL